MKSLSIPEQSDVDIGAYGPACEGFVDLLKSLFGKKKEKGPFDDNLNAVKGTQGYNVLTRNLEDDLRLTYDNPEWVAKHLGEASGMIHVQPLTLANVDGKPITSPSELLKAAQSMLKVVNDVAKAERPFIDLRRDLVNKISQKKDNAFADQMWEKHAKELTPTAADRFLQKYKGRHFPALANSPEKDGEWPVSDKKKWNRVFNNAYGHFKTDGMFEAPSAKNAKAYADAIRGMVAMLLELNKLADQTRIPYWEFLEVEYDELKYPNQIYDQIATADGWYEVSDLASGLSNTCYILALGLYIAMFDKHMIAKPATEGWVDRIKSVFGGRRVDKDARPNEAPPKFDAARTLQKLREFVTNPEAFNLTGKKFTPADKLYLSMNGNSPVISQMPRVLEHTVKEAIALETKLRKDAISHARLCRPLIERFEKTMVDNMDKEGNVDQAILDKAMEPLVAALPKVKQTYYHAFIDNKDYLKCSSWLGGKPINYEMRKYGKHEYLDSADRDPPVAVPAATDLHALQQLVEVLLKYTDENFSSWKDGMFEELEDEWISYEWDRPVRHLDEFMNDQQFGAICAIYSHDCNTMSLHLTLVYEMHRLHNSLLHYLDETLVRK